MKRFTHRNEGFKCENCEADVPDAVGTCRNHCTECLYSKHVDVNPGDRAAACGGKMRPAGLELKSGLPNRIMHVCLKCNFERPNKVAEDDNQDALLNLMEKF
ncbi:RNHCP domain-containing protein [bacterium]|nr:RNHCP domain-containing protein [bacterium]NCQ55751.1 RNHCP domain-containing protein [Candidatus Parcubacteria bacterium]NCS67700.1 RNHCP domain-containing protein [Candidatus Peregrinibacteria bacterium]NCS96714.1 RNHCP domain-containing protein [bacterium]